MAKLLPLLALALAVSIPFAFSANSPTDKIHESLKLSLAANLKANVFVSITGGDTLPILRQVELRNARRGGMSHSERTTSVYNALTRHADSTQAPLLEILRTKYPSLQVKSFWINNQLYLKDVDAGIVQELAALDQVAKIQEEIYGHIKNVYQGPDGPSVEGRGEVRAEWALENMRVPDVWADYGNVGEGLIIGNIDTGVRGTHELLREKYVGLEGNGWFDPEKKTTAPFDIYNHGTHTMGSLVGDLGIGIAPGGRWLACKGYRDNGSSTSAEFIACLEYMLCPHDTNGNNPDCSKAPHVVSNSWGWNGDTEFFNPGIYAWNAAGIVSSFSAGNTGPSCTSIYSPADQNNVLAVGATDINNALASFSSRGPSPKGQLKPEISAPGVSIRSASAASDTAYMSASGTPMSCPHATGVLSLLKNADRDLNQARAVELLKETARQNNPVPNGPCGGLPNDQYPNNAIGHGVIDALGAMQALLGKK